MITENQLIKRREDFALQVVPESFRRWGLLSLLSVMLGGSTAMFFFVFGATLVQTYGVINVIIALIVATLLFGTTSFFIFIIASETGLDIDLLTSGAGFGYKGAGFTSFIYACSYVIYFALEGSIIASGIHAELPAVSLWILYIIIGLAFIPLTWYGMTIMNYIMWISLPVYVGILAWSIIKASHVGVAINFWHYHPVVAMNPHAGPVMLQLIAIIFSLIATTPVAADIGRFVPKKNKLMSAFILSYVSLALAFIGGGLLGTWFTLKLGQINPGLYFPALLGVTGTFFLVLTQIRINVLNTYSGSLAFTTFFSRIFNFSPGRHWWVMLLVGLSIILMLENVLDHLQAIIVGLSIFTLSWMMTVLSHMLFKQKVFKLSAKNFPFEKNTLPSYNPVGLVSFSLALIVGIVTSFDLFGPFAKTLSPLLAGGIAFIMVPVMSFLLRK